MSHYRPYMFKSNKLQLEVSHIIVDDTAWLCRERYSSQQLFKNSATFKTWQSAINLYLMIKATNKCDKFMANSKLKEQGQKVEGI